MATCRERGNGTFEFVVRRKRLLPKPIYLTFDSREAGEAYCTRLEALLDAGVVPDEFKQSTTGGTMVFSRLVREYVSGHTPKADDVSKLDILVLAYGSTSLNGVNFRWVENIVHSLKREKQLSPSTVIKYAGALSRCFDWGVNKGYLLSNPVRQLPRGYGQYSPDDVRITGVLREDAHRDVRLPVGIEAAVHAAIEAKNVEVEAHHLLFDLALETAMRLREMVTLTREQISLKERTVFLEKTKNGSKRQVPLSSIALSHLKTHLKTLEGEFVFPWWEGDEAELSRVSSRLSKSFARIFQVAGIPHVRFHDLRHEATSRFFERTRLTDTEIAKITGHKDPRVLMRYANLRGSQLADKLW